MDSIKFANLEIKILSDEILPKGQILFFRKIDDCGKQKSIPNRVFTAEEKTFIKNLPYK